MRTDDTPDPADDEDDDDPRPSDPPFLFCILLAARKAKDEMLESLAQDWLREQKIAVVFLDEPDDLQGPSATPVPPRRPSPIRRPAPCP